MLHAHPYILPSPFGLWSEASEVRRKKLCFWAKTGFVDKKSIDPEWMSSFE